MKLKMSRLEKKYPILRELRETFLKKELLLIKLQKKVAEDKCGVPTLTGRLNFLYQRYIELNNKAHELVDEKSLKKYQKVLDNIRRSML